MNRHLCTLALATALLGPAPAWAVSPAEQARAIELNNAKNATLASYDSRQLSEIRGYCMQFTQQISNMDSSLIRELEAKGISPETYYKAPVCQPRGYSDVIASPMIHAVADDINKREETLNNIWLYYSKKRKQPEIFTELLNARNTKGETLLDYMVTQLERKQYRLANQYFALAYNVKLICEHGGTYATTLARFDEKLIGRPNGPAQCIAAFRELLE